jgi:hypothetical protein
MPVDFCLPVFDDAPACSTLFSHLYAAHSSGGGILGFLNMKDANALRATCKEAEENVANFQWNDIDTHIKGSIASWIRCFPNALAANIWGRKDLCDSHFQDLCGIHKLNMSHCNQSTITDAAFVHLFGIHTLNMCGCNQTTITDAAFAHLRGIQELDMSWCRQPTITDAAFVHLRGIHTLVMTHCNQITITDAAFAHLRGIVMLYMNNCNQPTITDAAFVHLRGIYMLTISGCDQPTITLATKKQLEKTVPILNYRF